MQYNRSICQAVHVVQHEFCVHNHFHMSKSAWALESVHDHMLWLCAILQCSRDCTGCAANMSSKGGAGPVLRVLRFAVGRGNLCFLKVRATHIKLASYDPMITIHSLAPHTQDCHNGGKRIKLPCLPHDASKVG
jgi:hypothetical protein